MKQKLKPVNSGFRSTQKQPRTEVLPPDWGFSGPVWLGILSSTIIRIVKFCLSMASRRSQSSQNRQWKQEPSRSHQPHLLMAHIQNYLIEWNKPSLHQVPFGHHLYHSNWHKVDTHSWEHTVVGPQVKAGEGREPAKGSAWSGNIGVNIWAPVWLGSRLLLCK